MSCRSLKADGHRRLHLSAGWQFLHFEQQQAGVARFCVARAEWDRGATPGASVRCRILSLPCHSAS
jgi:hypothetical protein